MKEQCNQIIDLCVKHVGDINMKRIKITENEYSKLTQELEFFDTMRNNLLTFSFTAVLAVLGVALGVEMNPISALICLIPFFLIIPFAARISYYRLASVHINSFLKVFDKKNMQFAIGADHVKENKCKHFKLIAWLINHEMVMLGVATCCIFYLKYGEVVENWQVVNYIIIIVPIILVLAVYIISDSTYVYKNLMNDFTVEWNNYSDNKMQ